LQKHSHDTIANTTFVDVTMKISNTDPLSLTRVASSCPASWEVMSGDDRVRFCSQCKLNVYNLSEMSKSEAEKLLRNHEGDRLCIKLHLRADGTIITQDCPVGIRLLKIRTYKTWKRLIATAASVLGMASQAGAQNAGPQPQGSQTKAPQEFVIEPKANNIPEPVKQEREVPIRKTTGDRADYGPYMKVVSETITKNWRPDKDLMAKHRATTVTFSILGNRQIANVKLIKSSGSKKLDKLALDCFNNLKEIPIPQPELSADTLDVEFTFGPQLMEQKKDAK